MKVNMKRMITCAVLSFAGFALAQAGEVKGRSWDRLSNVELSDDGAKVTPLEPKQIAVLGGRQIPLCMIGDSITWAQDGDCWRKWLIRDVPSVAFVGTHTGRFGYSHAGEGGNSTYGVIQRMDDPDRIPGCPYYHLMIGINDSSAAKCPADVPRVASNTVASVWRIVDRLLARPTTRKVFLAAILPVVVPKQPYRDMAGSAANAIMRAEVGGRYPTDRVVWVEYEQPLRRDFDTWKTKEYIGAGIHPAVRGYKAIADFFAPILLKEVKTGESAKGAAWGVEVENLWDEGTGLSRPLIPGWYVLSFASPKTVAVKVRLKNVTDKPKGIYDKTFDLDVKSGVRGEIEFMTGYDGYGYVISPFRLEVTDAEDRPVSVADIQIEKMRPSRKASRYGRGTFVDSTSPICAGEWLRPISTQEVR